MSQIRNPFEHHHDHGADDHDHAHDHALPQAPLDPAQQSLADALRVSFSILKLVMVVLLIVYALSGIVWSIQDQMVAVRLRFGQIVGQGDDALLRKGRVHFAFPYPIDQVVYIPTNPQQIDLNREFWYYVEPGRDESSVMGGPLNPDVGRDGSLITGDDNLIHARWSIQYTISDPLAFIRSVAAPSSNAKAVLASSDKLVRVAAENAVVSVVASVTADEAAARNLHPEAVRNRLQQMLNDIAAGITVNWVRCSDVVWPKAVADDFRAVSNALSESGRRLAQAEQERRKILSETAGVAADALIKLLDRYDQARALGRHEEVAQLDRRFAWIFDHLRIPGWAALEGPTGEALWNLVFQMDQAVKNNDPKETARLQQELAAALEAAGVEERDREMKEVGGQVARQLNEAQGYRSAVVADIRAEALAFNPRAIDPSSKAEGLLQQYRSSPVVFINRRWQDMIETVLAGDVDTFYVPKGQLYLELNRDPAVQKQREAKALTGGAKGGGK